MKSGTETVGDLEDARRATSEGTRWKNGSGQDEGLVVEGKAV